MGSVWVSTGHLPEGLVDVSPDGLTCVPTSSSTGGSPMVQHGNQWWFQQVQ